MRRSEMSDSQQRLRDSIVQKLGAAGWSPANQQRMFDDGLWTAHEVNMERPAAGGVGLQLRLDVERQRIHLSILRNMFQGITLYIDYRACLEPLLDAIVHHQDMVTEPNFRELVRAVVKVCPETYSADDEDGPLKKVVP